MLSSLSSFMNKSSLLDGRRPLLSSSKKTNKFSTYKYDDLDAKKPPSSPEINSPEKKKIKRVRFETEPPKEEEVTVSSASSVDAHDDDDDDDGGGKKEKGAVNKVKILMTKEEAARLLSKCKNGGVLQVEDVMNELVQIPINRVTLVSSSSPSCYYKSSSD